jgi:DNA-binding MarR family transcriptional regulator
MMRAAGDDELRSKELDELLNQLGLVKLLDVFLGKGAKPLTSSQLEEFTGVNQSTVSRATDQLAAAGIIKTSDEGDAYKYWLNDGHPAVDGLEEAHFELHLQADTIQTASPEFDSEHDNEHYHAGSPFVELFRYPTNVKLVAAFLEYPDAQLNGNEIADIAGISPKTAYDNIGLLCKVGLVRVVDHPQDKDLYTLDKANPASEGFITAYNDLKNQAAAGDSVNTIGESTDDEVVNYQAIYTAEDISQSEDIEPTDTSPDSDLETAVSHDETVAQLLRKWVVESKDDEDDEVSESSTDKEFKDRYVGTMAARRTDAGQTGYQMAA